MMTPPKVPKDPCKMTSRELEWDPVKVIDRSCKDGFYGAIAVLPAP